MMLCFLPGCLLGDTNRGTVAENMEQFVRKTTLTTPLQPTICWPMLMEQASWGIESVDMITAMRYLDLYEEAHSGPKSSRFAL